MQDNLHWLKGNDDWSKKGETLCENVESGSCSWEGDGSSDCPNLYETAHNLSMKGHFLGLVEMNY